MSGFVKKAVVWLGLNEEYPTDDRAIVEPPQADRAPRPSSQHVDRVPPSSVRPTSASPSRQPTRSAEPAGGRPTTYGPAGGHESSVRVIPMDLEPGEDYSSTTVRPVVASKTTKPHVIVPTSFNDAQSVADAFKDAKPVIVNMQSAERDLARRLIDFSSGLCYGLGGQMERVAEQVYLLTPSDVEVSDEERRRFLS